MRHGLEYLGWKVVTGLVRALPHTAARALGRWVGRIYYPLAGGRRRLTLANLERALPELDDGERRRIARACFAHYGMMFFELISADRFAAEEIEERFEVDGWEHVEALEATGKGYFLMTGHHGAWDLATYPLGVRLGRLHLLAKAQTNPRISREIETLRRRRGHVLVPAHGAGHRMLNVIRKGGRLALMIDQRVRPWDGVLLPFMGRPAWTTSVLAFLSLHTRAPVLPIYCLPTGGGRYRVEIEPPIVPDGRGPEAEDTLTREYLASIEARIRRHPELWMWMHSRWQLTVRHRWESTLERLRRDAELPAGRTFATLDAARLPGAVRAELPRWRRPEYLEACENLVVVGSDGEIAGHLGAALVDAQIEGGHAARWADAATLAKELGQAAAAGKLAARWRHLDTFELLALDGFDAALETDATETLRALVAQRAGRRSTLIVASHADRALELLPEPVGVLDIDRPETAAGAD